MQSVVLRARDSSTPVYIGMLIWLCINGSCRFVDMTTLSTKLFWGKFIRYPVHVFYSITTCCMIDYLYIDNEHIPVFQLLANFPEEKKRQVKINKVLC